MRVQAAHPYFFRVILHLLACSVALAQDSQNLEGFFKSEQAKPLRFAEPEDGLVNDYSALQQIILIRHGKPKISKSGWFNRREIMDYMVAYDTVQVHQFNSRPFEGNEQLKRVYTSKLQRSIHSAFLLLGPSMAYHPMEQFNEFQRKAMGFPNIKLPFGFWSGMSRILWLMGFNDRGIESFGAAKYRAFYNALFLENEAEKNGRALLVAHGFLNRYIAKYLRKRGWAVHNLDGKEYWGAYVIYRIRNSN
jgi:broad specificity phosphatase PhoE